MDPILSLPPDQFRAALAELQLDPQREAELVRQYRRANSIFAPIYGLIDRTIEQDMEAGRVRSDILPITRPRDMSGLEAIFSGNAEFAVPQGILGAIEGSAGAVDAPYAAYTGSIPREDMVGEALNLGGFTMGAGGVASRPAGSVGMGGRVASETPAQQIARMLREGRADEVTDDLMAQADPQEMYRLYESGETGADMPMDEASRMARAQEMSFLDNQYHATFDDFPAFMVSETGLTGRGVYTGDDAGDVMDYARSRRTNIEGLNAIPLLTPEGSTYARRIDWQNTLDADLDLPYNATWQQNVEGMRRAADTMSGQGFSGVHSQPGERVTFNPNRLRSRFARFDPRLSHLSNLNAANVDPITGLAAMSASQQNDPLANLRAYIAAAGGVLGR